MFITLIKLASDRYQLCSKFKNCLESEGHCEWFLEELAKRIFYFHTFSTIMATLFNKHQPGCFPWKKKTGLQSPTQISIVVCPLYLHKLQLHVKALKFISHTSFYALHSSVAFERLVFYLQYKNISICSEGLNERYNGCDSCEFFHRFRSHP